MRMLVVSSDCGDTLMSPLAGATVWQAILPRPFQGGFDAGLPKSALSPPGRRHHAAMDYLRAILDSLSR